MNERLDLLIHGWQHGELGLAERDELVAALESRESRAQLVAQLRLSQDLREVLAEDSAARERLHERASGPQRALPRRLAPRRVATRPLRAARILAIACALAVGVGSAVAWGLPRPTAEAAAVSAGAVCATVSAVGDGMRAGIIRADGGLDPIAVGAELHAGDRLAASGPTDAAAVALSLPIGGTIDLAGGTTLAFESPEVARLERGRLYAAIDPAAGAALGTVRLRIAATAAEVRVHGTRFELAADTASTTVRMEEGVVDFGNERGRRAVGALEECAAALGAAPSEPTDLRPHSPWRGFHAGEPVLFRLSLIDADTLRPIPGYDPIPADVALRAEALPPRIALRADASAGTARMAFALDGATRIETGAPFYLGGRDAEGIPLPWTPAPGLHALVATPEAAARGSSLTVRLTSR